MNWFGVGAFFLVVFLNLQITLERTENVFSIMIILTSMTAASMLDCTVRKPAYQYKGTLQLLDAKLEQVSVGKKKKIIYVFPYICVYKCLCIMCGV